MLMSSSRFFRYFLFLGQRGLSKVCSVGTRWMRNQIPHPTSSPNRNLSKNTGRYVENTSRKSSIFLFSPKLINIILLFQLLFYYFNYYFIIFLRRPILDPKIPLMDSKLTSKRQVWEEHKSAPRDKGMQTQAQVLPTMDYSFFALNYLMPSMYPKSSLYSFSKG